MARGGINHLGLTLRDLAGGEKAFYGPVLGFLGYEKVHDEAGMMSVWYNASARTALNLWQAHADLADRPHMRYAPGFQHLAFDAESREEVDALHAFLVGRGFAVLDAPAEYPQYTPGYYAVFFEDPNGLKFEFVHMPVIPD